LEDLVVWAQAARNNPQSWRLIQLRGVVAAALHQLNGSLQEAGATVQIDDTLPQIRGGFGSLQLLLQVLVANAIQYRKPQTGVHIFIGAKQGPAEEWVVSVADDGIGIDPSHCESIFAPLQRLHGNELPGSGMGLAICKRIVAAHGGADLGGIDAGFRLDVLFHTAGGQRSAGAQGHRLGAEIRSSPLPNGRGSEAVTEPRASASGA